MSSPPADAATATAGYQAAQITLRARFAAQLLALWPVLDKQRVGATSPDWLRLAIALVQQWRDASSVLAAAHYAQVHERAVGVAIPRPPIAPELPNVAIIKDLLWAGPGELKRARLQGLDAARADNSARLLTGYVGSKLVLSGGRDTTAGAITADPRALGWMRVADANPCAWCAMLASRGAVYKTRESAGDPSLNAWHPKCDCHVEPVFTRNAALPESSKRYADLWRTSTRGTSGKDAVAAFRAAYDAAQQQTS